MPMMQRGGSTQLAARVVLGELRWLRRHRPDVAAQCAAMEAAIRRHMLRAASRAQRRAIP